MTPVQSQFADLLAQNEGAVLDPLPDGSFVVTVPEIKTGNGWSALRANVKFIVPVQFPMARPDCFWADEKLLLVDGRAPQNTGPNPIPGGSNVPLRWYSWHVTHWSPNDDTLTTYLNVIRKRFADAR